MGHRPAHLTSSEVDGKTWCALGDFSSFPSCHSFSLANINTRHSNWEPTPVLWDVNKPWLPWSINEAPYQTLSEYSDKMDSMLTSVRHVCEIISPVVLLPSQKVGPQLSAFDSGVTGQAGLCTTRDSFLEGLAFLHWFDAVFTYWECLPGMTSHMINDIQSASLFQTSNRRGVVVDLERDWLTMNIPFWMFSNIPVFYQWTEGVAGNPRFQVLSPHTSTKSHFDIFLNDTNAKAALTKTLNISTSRKALPAMKTFIIDFEGWKRRPLSTKSKRQKYTGVYPGCK